MPGEEWDVMQALSRQSAVARAAQLCREGHPRCLGDFRRVPRELVGD